MLSHQQLRAHAGGCRWGSEQAGNVARSAVVGRLVVANATRLRAKAEAQDEETVFSVSSGLQLKLSPTSPLTSSPASSIQDQLQPSRELDQLQHSQQQQQQQPAHPLPAGVTPERDREIHNELRGCEDWRDVLDIVADEAACLSVRTAVQALTRLNTLTRGSPGARRELVEHQAFQTLKEVLYSQVSLMNNVQLSNSLYAFAQLQVVLPELLCEGYTAAAVARVDSFYPRDIATLLAAAAAMRWSPPRQLLDAMGFRAMGFLSGQEFDARSIPTLLHSMALLGYKNPLLAQAAAQRLAAPGVMASLVPQGVANSMWALGRLDTYHPPAVAAALSAFSSAPLSYKPQEVANLLWALTAFRHHPEANFVLFAKSLLHRSSPPSAEHERNGSGSGFGSGPGQIRAADLATLLYALATFNVSPGVKVMERLEAAAAELVRPEAETAEAAGTAGAGVAAQPGPGSAAVQPPHQQWRRQKARAGFTSSSGNSGGGGIGSSSAISVVELAHMYWGLALLGEVERPLFGLLEGRLAAAWEREGAAIPEPLLRTVFQASRESCGAGWAVTITRSFHPPAHPPETSSLPPPPHSRLSDAASCFQGYLASKLESPRRSPAFPPLALDAMKRAWTGDLEAASNRKGRGRRVDQVARILDILKVTYDKRRPTGDGLALIDIALKAGPERYVALQVIDVGDQCTNSKQLLGQVAMVGQVLEKNGWEVRQRPGGSGVGG
ncbi:hypothetical protein VOLCADRAFT_88468 [Volvox carteri f. nagariensis]|uniref:RNA-editing substrate-binding complex 6 protein domain-containing protein n=1 Tax=Volvox carteri f. nagariensis TaxID=3068 RepID=D8TP29_VOLCA|nr:uncharacterized protein VOLCADRAFT_88468 [Volvox carteri f. nagariensis]EFJ50550.1 hypothetical protein VOLCADRAFT_88468 [Volvox carteri f. nagariensis]|eukprot:XP_002948143.1 hypothetical protein VOLCADRAFT_88468 [Volvox carteri f. nagariensis]